MAETSAHFPGGSDKPQHAGHSGRMQMQKRNEDLLFRSACEAPAIILIWSCPEGSYYSIYYNSLDCFISFARAKEEGEKKKVPSDQKNVLGACASALRLHVVVLGAVM